MKFDVGDEVYHVCDRLNPYVSPLLQVTKVSARMVTVSDGTKWARDGRQWGNSSDTWYMGPHLYRNADGNHGRAKLRHRRSTAKRLLRDLSDVSSDNLTEELLDKIEALAKDLRATKQVAK